jgi:NADPH2:quinone reductase
MTKAIVIAQPGGPEVLELKSVDVGRPGTGELRLRQTAIGVNFHDIYVRSGQYSNVLAFPGIPGVEACGIVTEVGSGVTGISPGDRVAYVARKYGAYAEERLLRASLAVKVPDGIDDKAAASLMVRGLTAAILLLRIHVVRSGDIVLVQAAAGGVGKLLCQWARHLGATVIGTAGGAEKVAMAMHAGCHYAIDYKRENFVDRVREITDGNGVAVAYDSVGKDTFAGSLECIARCGHLINFGQASGPVEPLAMSQLAAKSATVSRPIVFDYIEDRAALDTLSRMAFQALADGVIRLDGIRQYALGDAAQAHRDLEARVPMGSPVLVP